MSDAASPNPTPAGEPAPVSVPPAAVVPPAPPPPRPAPSLVGAAKGKFSLYDLLFRHRSKDEIAVYHHSNLFYWWPVWLIGYIACAISYFADQHLAIVPAGTRPVQNLEVDFKDEKGQLVSEKRDLLILKHGAKLRTEKDENDAEHPVEPKIYIAPYRTLGTVYALVLLLIITFTSVTLRGLWSILLLVLVICVTTILLVGGWLGAIFHTLGQMSVYINMGGYFLISTVLFVLWVINLCIFDRQTYMIFTPGQVRVRLEIGGAETAFDTTGIVVQKQRVDMFRHWVLGFGSGDLIIRPAALNFALELPNVLHVHRVVEQIEQMVKEKVVVRGPGH